MSVVVAAALGAAAPAAAPPAGELAFERGGDLFAVRADGSGLRRLTSGPARDYSPAWSPDGRRLAFVSYRDGDAEIYVADARGRILRQVTRNAAEDLQPAWSPDGRRLAFASNRTGGYEIYHAGVAGGAPTRVTRGATQAYGSFSPAWSPDGWRIAYASSVGTPENQELYLARADGSDVRRLTRTKGSVEVLGDDASPSFAPDGRRIAFLSNRTGTGAVWLLRLAGGGQWIVIELPRRDVLSTRFSPDGEWIAFEARSGARSDVHLVRPDGTGLRRVVAGGAPAWRP
jgi:TolB protein